MPEKDSALTRATASLRRDYRDAITHPYRRGAGMWFDRVWIMAFLPLIAVANLVVGILALAAGKPTGWVNVILFLFIAFLIRSSMGTAAMSQRTKRSMDETVESLREMVRDIERRRGIVPGDGYNTPLYPPADWTKGEDR